MGQVVVQEKQPHRHDIFGVLARQQASKAELSGPPIILGVVRERGRRIWRVGQDDPASEVRQRIGLLLIDVQRHSEKIRKRLHVATLIDGRVVRINDRQRVEGTTEPLEVARRRKRGEGGRIDAAAQRDGIPAGETARRRLAHELLEARLDVVV